MNLRHLYITFIIAFIPLLHFASQLEADVKDDFVQPFGLIVHEGNSQREVTRGKALEVVLRYFSHSSVGEVNVDVNFTDIQKENPSYPYVKRACRLRLLNCSKGEFKAEEPVQQKTFLTWFYTLKQIDDPNFLSELYPKVKMPYLRAWLHARNFNYLENKDITYKTLKEFLYRFEVSQLHDGIPFFEGLVLDESDITKEVFNSIPEVREIEDKLTREIQRIKGGQHSAATSNRLVRQYSSYRDKFIELEKELIELNHPINKLPNMPEEIKEKIKKHDLNDILGQFAYDYSHNAPYRKHNVTEGALSVNGRVIMPGETMDYLDALRTKGWGKFVYGWTVVGGVETWEFGGGLSGSSTMISLPAWLAGLELVKFSPHNIYYLDLYPEEYIGLDTTLYRPNKNLVVRNTTESPVLYYVDKNEEKEIITVYVIGNSPFKTYSIEGPIKVGNRKYKWIRQGERRDGTLFYDERVTKYAAVY